MSDLESDFQKEYVLELEETFPGSMIIRGNSSWRQGVPDWMLLHGPNWAALELKRDAKAVKQPNQPYYVEKMNAMSYASFVYPSNAKAVIREIQQAFGSRG